MTNNRPTIQELAPGYVSVGISKKSAVHYIVDQRLRSGIARGHGRKAARRSDAIKIAHAYEVILQEELGVRMPDRESSDAHWAIVQNLYAIYRR